MVEEQPAQQALAQLADRLRQVSADPDLGATLEVAGDVLEGGDAATAARMLLDRADAELGEGTWQELVSALLAEQQSPAQSPAEQQSPADQRDAAGQGGGTPSADAVDAPDSDTGSDDPLAAALRDFADELAWAATARARGDLDARQALARLKAGFHATRRTLAAVQREELRSRLARAR